jgi:putative addiction module killer protein
MRVEITKTYLEWQSNLKDLVVRARIQARVERLRLGNPGHHRVLSDGVIELKLDFGAGYRVYYTQRGKTLIILLAGGDKSSQQADIKTAIQLANNL